MPGGIWSSNNIVVAPISATGDVSANTIGTAVISYTLMPSGCYTAAVATVNALPVVYPVTGGGNYCAGGAGVNVGTGASQPGKLYTLIYGSTAISTLFGTGSPLSFGLHTAAGSYTISATDTGSGCRSDMSGSAIVSVTPLAMPTVSMTSGTTTTLCSGGVLSNTATAVNGGVSPTYVWRKNGAIVSTLGSYDFIPSNGDVLTVKMTSNAACRILDTATASTTITVVPTEIPDVHIGVSPGDVVCASSTVTYVPVISGGGPAPAYVWKVNGVYAGGGTSLVDVPADNDNVVCMLVSNAACRTADTVYSNVVEMTVLPNMVPVVTISASPGLSIIAGTPLTLTASVTNAGAAPVYQWSVNGTLVPGATLATFTSSTFGNGDIVDCRVTSTVACGSSTVQTVHIAVTYPNGVLNAELLNNIQLVPNPNNGTFRITGLQSIGQEDLSVAVTDMIGQVVYSGIVHVKTGAAEGGIQLDNTLVNGMYILNIRSEVGSKAIHFVVRR